LSVLKEQGSRLALFAAGHCPGGLPAAAEQDKIVK